VILTSLWIWNDFLIPLILLSDPAKKTLPLGTTAMFFGTYMNKWNLGITAILMASLPMLLLFFVMQKHIVKGITAGSVKG
jgi:raffinose/stachyose/melibiose transport system permease protein